MYILPRKIGYKLDRKLLIEMQIFVCWHSVIEFVFRLLHNISYKSSYLDLNRQNFNSNGQQ